jgi:hypothetical protein
MTPTRNILKGGVRTLTFSKWLEDFDFDLIIDGNSIIYMNEKYDYNGILDIISKEFKDDIIDEVEYYLDLSEQGIKSGEVNLKKLLNHFNHKDPYEFLEYLENI